MFYTTQQQERAHIYKYMKLYINKITHSIEHGIKMIQESIFRLWDNGHRSKKEQ
jgi:alanine-alpha-ketoisovalerate/valine-pyruvate aminotransferase